MQGLWKFSMHKIGPHSMKEQWKPIAGFEAYEVSSMGRVRRAVEGMTAGKVGTRKACLTGNGYLFVTLYREGKAKTRMVHQLVASAFIPNPLGLPQVNHKDGCKGNCRADNLEWRSVLGNHRHALKMGLAGDSIYRNKWGRWEVKYSPEPYAVKFLGTFPTKREALRVRRAAVESLPDIL